MKNKYESVIIFDPEYAKLKYKIKKYKDLLKKYSEDFEDFKLDDMGERKLAYEIRKRKSGYYILIQWQGTPENVLELERLLRTDDIVIKFITIKMSEDEEELDEYEKGEFDEEAEVDATEESEQESTPKSAIEIDYFDVAFDINE